MMVPMVLEGCSFLRNHLRCGGCLASAADEAGSFGGKPQIRMIKGPDDCLEVAAKARSLNSAIMSLEGI